MWRRLRIDPHSDRSVVGYAHDFVIVVSGDRRQAQALIGEVGRVLAPLGLRDLIDRGMRSPALVVADGAPGALVGARASCGPAPSSAAPVTPCAR